MKFIQHKGLLINPAQIAFVERGNDGSLTIHFCTPKATTVPYVQYPMGTAPPVASDHVTVGVPSGEDADAIWAALVTSS